MKTLKTMAAAFALIVPTAVFAAEAACCCCEKMKATEGDKAPAPMPGMPNIKR